MSWITFAGLEEGGNPSRATGGKVSKLAISSDDMLCLLMETENCPAVSLQVNYLDLVPRREIIVNGDGHCH